MKKMIRLFLFVRMLALKFAWWSTHFTYNIFFYLFSSLFLARCRLFFFYKDQAEEGSIWFSFVNNKYLIIHIFHIKTHSILLDFWYFYVFWFLICLYFMIRYQLSYFMIRFQGCSTRFRCTYWSFILLVTLSYMHC